jgi:hypothetical protein
MLSVRQLPVNVILNYIYVCQKYFITVYIKSTTLNFFVFIIIIRLFRIVVIDTHLYFNLAATLKTCLFCPTSAD